MEELVQLCKDYVTAKQKYEHAVRIIVRTSPVMQDKSLFWKMLSDLILFIERRLHKRDDPVRNGIYSWLNHAWSKQEEGYSDTEIPSFLRTYSELKKSLAKRILKMDNNNESELTDIIDSLPLAGKNICLRVVSDEIKDTTTLESLVERGSLLADCILHKENHSEQWLEQVYADKLCEVL